MNGDRSNDCGCACEACAKHGYHEFCAGKFRCSAWKPCLGRPHIRSYPVGGEVCVECGARASRSCGRWPLDMRHNDGCSHGPAEHLDDPAPGWVPDGHGGMVYTGPVETKESEGVLS
jgi:hypothetical protein